jgi:hypothetical protein
MSSTAPTPLQKPGSVDALIKQPHSMSKFEEGFEFGTGFICGVGKMVFIGAAWCNLWYLVFHYGIAAVGDFAAAHHADLCHFIVREGGNPTACLEASPWVALLLTGLIMTGMAFLVSMVLFGLYQVAAWVGRKWVPFRQSR